MHSSTKTRLMTNNDRPAAIRAVLLSGPLSDPQLQQFLDILTERALRRVLGLPGCSHWTGRGHWDTWAVEWLHSKDRGSLCLVRATERIIALTTKEAQRNLDNPYADAPIWAAVEAARTANSRCEGSLRYHALLASWSAIRTASYAAVALSGYSPRVTEAIEAEAIEAEREQQCQDLLSLINNQ